MSMSEKKTHLMSLGFSMSLIDLVLEGSSVDASLEELVIALSDMEDLTNRQQTIKSTSYLSKFVILINEHQGIDQKALPESELEAKFEIARSIADILDDGTTDKDVVTLLQWATDMIKLQQELMEVYSSAVSIPQHCVTDYLRLDSIRRHIDTEASIGLHMLSDAEVERLSILNDIAARGTDGEKHLHQLLLRFDKIQREINGFQQRLAIYVSSEQCISRPNLEELYLYLKEQVRLHFFDLI